MTFYDRSGGGLIYFFGGNQSNSIKESHAPESAMTSVHYRWPS